MKNEWNYDIKNKKSEEDPTMQKQFPWAQTSRGAQSASPPHSNGHVPCFIPWIMHDLVRGPFSCPVWGQFGDPQPMFQPYYSDNRTKRLKFKVFGIKKVCNFHINQVLMLIRIFITCYKCG